MKDTKIQSWLLPMLVLALGIGTGACSSSKSSGEGDGSSETGDAPPPDAGTDAVPEGSLESSGEAASPPPAEGGDATEQQPTQEAAAESPPATETPPATEPAAPPSESNSASSAVAGTGEYTTYTVQAGDTLMKIAFENYGDLYQWKKILEANQDKITNPNALPAGLSIQLEKTAAVPAIDRNGEKYLIRGGDTLGKISKEVYGVISKWRKIYENNRQLIHDPNRIYAGFYLYYLMSPEDAQERDRLLNTPATPAPNQQLSDAGGTPSQQDTGARDPASSTNPAPPPAEAAPNQ